jgi:hypothetical protein
VPWHERGGFWVSDTNTFTLTTLLYNLLDVDNKDNNLYTYSKDLEIDKSRRLIRIQLLYNNIDFIVDQIAI